VKVSVTQQLGVSLAYYDRGEFSVIVHTLFTAEEALPNSIINCVTPQLFRLCRWPMQSKWCIASTRV